jgi:hypothetical protein
MVHKPVADMPDIRLREAVAVYIWGKGYTEENLKAVAITKEGRWYKYPVGGTWERTGNMITIKQEGKRAKNFI